MKAPSILLDPGGKSDTFVSDIPTRTGVDNMKQLMTYFDSIVVLKEKYPPAYVRLGPKDRRLVLIEPETDQHFLVQKEKTFGNYVPGGVTLLEATQMARHDFEKYNSPAFTQDLLIPERIANYAPGFEPSLVVKFIESLPIPADTVPLDEVFEFRETRAAELSDFWHRLYDVAGQVACMRAANPTREIGRILGKSLEDCQKAANRSWGARVARSLSVRFTLSPAAVAELSPAFMNLKPVNILLGIAGHVGFSVDLLPRAAQPSETARPLSYALEVQQMR